MSPRWPLTTAVLAALVLTVCIASTHGKNWDSYGEDPNDPDESGHLSEGHPLYRTNRLPAYHQKVDISRHLPVPKKTANVGKQNVLPDSYAIAARKLKEAAKKASVLPSTEASSGSGSVRVKVATSVPVSTKASSVLSGPLLKDDTTYQETVEYSPPTSASVCSTLCADAVASLEAGKEKQLQWCNVQRQQHIEPCKWTFLHVRRHFLAWAQAAIKASPAITKQYLVQSYRGVGAASCKRLCHPD